MKIGRTNAIAISGGGTTKTDYELWQEGFGYNWDSIVANAPMTNTQRILHVYTKVNVLKLPQVFPTSLQIYTYNGSTYRQLQIDSNKQLLFIEADYMTNSSNNLKYITVIYGGTVSNWSNYCFSNYMPVVYANSKSCNDYCNNLINLGAYIIPSIYPFLRGLDINILSGAVNNQFCIGESLEHLTIQNYDSVVSLQRLIGKEVQVKILKQIVDNAPSVTLYSAQYITANVSDEKLSDWLYNDFFYNRFLGNTFAYALQQTNIVRKFNIRPDIQFSGESYLNRMPNMVYLEGFISENINNTTYAGRHGFNNSGWTMLQNFPMWKVKEGASTGCLLPVTTINSNANFVFYSKYLERNKFVEFDVNGNIIEDPTKYFLCNLPVQSQSGQSVRFVTNAFWSLFTANEITKIEAYIALKNWAIIWQ